MLKRQFKTEQLWPPEFKDKAYHPIEYDFSMPQIDQSIFSKDIIWGGSKPGANNVNVSPSKKPKNLSGIDTEPKFMLDFDPRELQTEYRK